MGKAEKIGELRFCLDDYRDDMFNNSVDCTFSLYGNNMSELVSIEDFYYYCIRMARAIGWTNSTIEDWFGDL